MSAYRRVCTRCGEAWIERDTDGLPAYFHDCLRPLPRDEVVESMPSQHQSVPGRVTFTVLEKKD